MDEQRIRKLVRELIAEIGEDPTREGLTKTPDRVADAYKEIFAGYDSNSELSVQFSEDSEVVVVRDIHFIPCVSIIYCHFLEKFNLHILQTEEFLEFQN